MARSRRWVQVFLHIRRPWPEPRAEHQEQGRREHKALDHQEHSARLLAAPTGHSSAFGKAQPEGLGVDITKTLGNNALLRFGTRLCVLQNVIKILLMGQRGVETHVGKAARSQRVHMRARRPCVQRREGGREAARAGTLLLLLSLHLFLTYLSPSQPSTPSP